MGVLQDLENSIIPIAQLNDDGAPTASIAILENGKISAHVITAGKENTDTVYQACSISKAITGLAVARMVDMGLITYQTKVIDHLPSSITENIAGSKNKHLFERVTVAMLLSHTSGLSQGGFPGFTTNLPTAEDIIAGRAPARTPKIVFNAFPGTQQHYSGGGFVLLQVIMEEIMHKPFPQIMKDIVFEPLSMDRSWYSDLSSGETNFAKAHFNGFTETEPVYHRFVEMAAAGLWTTPTDLLKAISAVQRSIYTNESFLRRDTAREMLTEAGTSEDHGAFGMGWGVDQEHFSHAGGNDPGYMSYFFGTHKDRDDPESERKAYGVAVMVNSHYFRWRNVITQIVSAIFFLKGWKRYEELPGSFGEDGFAPYAAPEGTAVGDDWKKWLGKWEEGWEIIDSDGPSLTLKSEVVSRLKPAAAPVSQLSDGKKELIFVVDGVRTGVRLTWHGEEQIIELLGAVPRTLKRSST